MKDFICDEGVRIICGAGQENLVIGELAKLGTRLLIVPTGSFLEGGHYEKLVEMIASFGPMPCRIMPVTAESLADIIEDAVHGKLS